MPRLRVAAGPPNAALIDSWVAIHANNTATIAFGKIDITGAPTGLLQIAAEELDLTIQQVRAAAWNTDISPNQGLTAGSNSISSGGPQVRQAAAEARAVLLGLASKQLGVPVSRLTVRAGIVSDRDDASKKVAYGELLGGKTFSAPNTGRAPLKPFTEYKLVGQRVKRKDTPAKVDGSHPYVHQLRLPGMLHGRIVRPEGQGPYGVIDKPLSVDESSIKNIKGARVVRKGDFVGVVAANEQDAIQAATQLKVKWSESKTMPGNGNLWKHFREAKPNDRFTRNTGSVDKGLAGAAIVREASYSVSYQSHASFGPSCGVADVKPGKANVWGASQGIYSSRTLVAGLLGMPADQVTFHFAEGAGCYGRNLQDDAAGCRRADVPARRCAGARPAHPRPGARLGLLRPGDARGHPRRSRRGREDHGLRLRVVPAAVGVQRGDRVHGRHGRCRSAASAGRTPRTRARSTRSRTTASWAARSRTTRGCPRSRTSGPRPHRRRSSPRSR